MRPIARHSLAGLALAWTIAPALAADDLGTLFNSPEERARLDRLRRGEPVASATQRPDGTLVHSHKPALTGYVQRSDGRDTVWIDGRPVVIAAPDGHTLLQPNMVQPRGADAGVRIEETDKPAR